MELSDSQIVTGNTPQTRPENRAFYPALDGLRAVAFFMVFFYHYDDMAWGFAGVDVFFVLSGFLITGILYDTRNDLHRARNFYVRRTLRIFPLYYGVMLVILLLEPVVHWQWSWYWLVWPFYVGNLVPYFIPHFAPNAPFEMIRSFVVDRVHGGRFTPLALGHFWTLCVEEQFYLVWPWLVFAIRDRRKLIWICSASIPICLIARMLGDLYLPSWMLGKDLLFHATPFRVDDLLLGGLLALLLRGPHAGWILRWSRLATPLAFATLIVTSLFFPFHRIWSRPYSYPSYANLITWGLTIIGLLTALLILRAIQPQSLVARILSCYPLRWVGRISYGAYVLHVIPRVAFVQIGKHLMPAHAELFTSALALCLTLLLAWLSYRFYESPFLNLKERWTIRS